MSAGTSSGRPALAPDSGRVTPPDTSAATPLAPTSSPRQLAALALHGSEQDQWWAAAHPNTPPQVLHRLAHVERLAEVVAENPSAHAVTLAWLFSRYPHLAPTLAANPHLPSELVTAFAAHPAPVVRGAVAGRWDCPLALLEVLAVDPDGYVRWQALANRRCPMAAKISGALLNLDAGVAHAARVPLLEPRPTAIDLDHPWARLVGPFYDEDGVADLLAVSRRDVRAVTTRGKLWGVRDNLGHRIYPVAQFDPTGQVIVPVTALAHKMSQALGDPWAAAAWVMSPADELGGCRPLDVVLSGQEDLQVRLTGFQKATIAARRR